MISRLYSLFFLLYSCVLLLPSHAELHRGVWFWGSTTLPDASPSPFGSIDVVDDVVADGTDEDETIAFFTAHGVKRVYGSYQNRPVSDAGDIAAWNTKLDDAGIESQLLLDGNEVADVGYLTTKITNRLINFNLAMGTDEAAKFDALHLDLEPQGLPAWDSGTPADKRALLQELYDAYVTIRNHLTAAGAPFDTMPIYADMPFFWDKLPVDSGSVDWADAADRDDWYSDCTTVLEGISVMTFSKDNFASVDAAIDYERTGPFVGKARVGIQPKVGPGELWLAIFEYNAVMNDLEAAYGPTGATDIENYAFWRHAIETTGVTVGTPIVVTLSSDADGPIIWGDDDDPVISDADGPIIWGDDDDPVIVFPGISGYLYTVKQGSHPGQGLQTVTQVRTRSVDLEILRIPVSPQGSRSFWQVERVREAQ